jgi:DNA-binding LacI/PurR family transcriptional regulator
MRRTLKDIAKEVNLSVNTVSRALRGFPGVSEKNRRRIQQLAKTYNYVPSRDARSLVLQSSQSIGVLVPDLRVPYLGEITSFLQQALQEKGYFSYVLTTSGEVGQSSKCAESLVERRVDGLISMTVLTPQTLEMLRYHRIPVLFLVVYQEELPLHFVGYDDEAGGDLAASHLIEIGHKRIAYFTGNWEAESFRTPRCQGFLRAIEESNGTVQPMLFPHVYADTAKAGYACSRDLVDRIRSKEVQAVFCVCDAVALGLMHRLYEERIRVPEDVSIMGYDNIEMAEFSTPPLTTVWQDAERIARLGAMLILQMLSSEEDWDRVRQQVFLEPTLILRKSTLHVSSTSPGISQSIE